MFVRNTSSWVGLNFSHAVGEVLDLPENVAKDRIAAGLAEELTGDELQAHIDKLPVVRPSPDLHPDHVPGAFTGGVTSVANPNHRPGKSYLDGQAEDVRVETDRRAKRGRKIVTGPNPEGGSQGTLNPSAPAAATLEPGAGVHVNATTGEGAPLPNFSDTGSGHTAESGSAATADALAKAADAGPLVQQPQQPAADTSNGG